MSNTPRNLTRGQLAEFLPNARAIRAFEQVLKNASDLLPADLATINRLIQELTIDAGTANSKADEALDLLGRIASSLEVLALAPVQQDQSSLPELLPPPGQQSQSNAPELVLPPVPGITIDELSDVTNNLPAAGNTLLYDATLQRYVNALLTAGTNVTITNADGSVTISVTGSPPTGSAGGVLSGMYPNPGFAVDMATQAELDAHTGATAAHGATGVVVGTTNTQTLTNKTLSAPVVTGLTNLQGGQIQFPSTQVPSAGANTLDDYVESSSWLPSLVGSSSPGAATYTIRKGAYTKIGNVVHFSLYVSWTAHTGSGTFRINNLPFTQSPLAEPPFSALSYTLGVPAGSLLGAAGASSTTLLNVLYLPTGGGAYGFVSVVASGDLAISGTYIAA